MGELGKSRVLVTCGAAIVLVGLTTAVAVRHKHSNAARPKVASGKSHARATNRPTTTHARREPRTNTAPPQFRNDDLSAGYHRAGRKPGPPRIALVGDSITVNYQKIASAKLQAEGFNVSSFGRSATGILDADYCQGRFGRALINYVDPDVVVFENIGNYGYFKSCDPKAVYDNASFYGEWQREARRETQILTSKGAVVYWLLNPSVPATNAGRRETIARLNGIYYEIAFSTPRTHTIDAWTPFGGDTPNCSLRDPNGFEPCLHLSRSGCRLMAEIVDRAVKNE